MSWFQKLCRWWYGDPEVYELERVINGGIPTPAHQRRSRYEPCVAATDTGLVTVGNITEECLLELKQMLCGEIHPCNDIGDVTDADIELVTRSQAEELSAAKDERIAFLERVVADQETQIVKQSTLEADNAALTARLETGMKNWRDSYEAFVAMRDSINEHVPMPSLEASLLEGLECGVMHEHVAKAVIKHVETLEAKLAAAEKALESAANDFDALFCTPRVTETKSTDDQFDLVIAMAGRFGTDARKARAVLGGKPSCL